MLGLLFLLLDLLADCVVDVCAFYRDVYLERAAFADEFVHDFFY